MRSLWMSRHGDPDVYRRLRILIDCLGGDDTRGYSTYYPTATIIGGELVPDDGWDTLFDTAATSLHGNVPYNPL